jgi:DNA-binding CsgD family transcriptional regulator
LDYPCLVLILEAKNMESATMPQLTKRENEILMMIAIGRCNKEIAKSLQISIATTQNHLQHLYRKLGARNRTEAAERYWKKSVNLSGKND